MRNVLNQKKNHISDFFDFYFLSYGKNLLKIANFEYKIYPSLGHGPYPYSVNFNQVLSKFDEPFPMLFNLVIVICLLMN